MKQGQISIDLLLTLVVAIMVIGSITFIVDNAKENQEIVALENQLRTTATTAATFITSTNAMKGTEFSTQMQLEKISYKGTYFYPEININPSENKLLVFYDANGQIVQASEVFAVAPGVVIEPDNIKGILVVKNA